MGGCYEKLGQSEARKAYEQVLKDYPGQRELAAQARARLAALGQGLTATGPVISELKVEPGQVEHALSWDGSKIAYTDMGRKGNLVVTDLASGAEKQVTDVKAGAAAYPVWPPDGKRIAYQYRQTGTKHELRIVSLETGQDRGVSAGGEVHHFGRFHTAPWG